MFINQMSPTDMKKSPQTLEHHFSDYLFSAGDLLHRGLQKAVPLSLFQCFNHVTLA